jgi:ribosomal-protein-serine acetyltransferase
MNIATLTIQPWLKVHPIAPSHAPALAALIEKNFQHLQEYLPAVAAMTSLTEVQAHINASIEKKHSGDLLDWHIFADGVLCGSVRVNRIELADRKAALAYFLDAQYQGRGIVTRSARAVIDVCFKELELNRLELRCVTTNTTSVAVAERLGFSREGLLRQDEFLNGKFVDHYLYGLLRQDAPAV